MKSPVVKRSIVIAGHKTSVSLEDAFWKGLKEIATGRGLTLSEMVGRSIRRARKGTCRRRFAYSSWTTIVYRWPQMSVQIYLRLMCCKRAINS